MKLLFATGRMLFPFFRGGDGTTAAQMLTGLNDYGIECIAIGKLNPRIGKLPLKQIKQRLKTNGIEYRITVNELIFETDIRNHLVKSTHFETVLVEIISKFNPDIIITQLDDSEIIIRIANCLNIKSILYVHDCTNENFKALNEVGLSFIFYNSFFISEYFKKFISIPSTVIYPVFNDKIYCTNCNPFYITMVNPTNEKGGQIALECCKWLSHIPFQILNGWQSKTTLFKGLKNVQTLKFGHDMKQVYSSTKILIAPSQCDEAFCRLPVEAGLNSIPTVASNVGGLRESVGKGGILIKEYKDTEAWLSAIKYLYNNQSKTNALGKLAKLNSQKFTIDKIIPKIIKQIII